MEILNTQRFNEGINIKPVTKTMMKNLVKNVKIGNRYWSVENAKITVANDGKPLVKGVDYFVFNNEYYYTKDAAERITPNGWYIPDKEDFSDFMHTVSENGTYLRCISKDYGGTDDFGFCAKLVGSVNRGTLEAFGQWAAFAMYNDKDGHTWCAKLVKDVLNENGRFFMERLANTYALSVRFVKDI